MRGWRFAIDRGGTFTDVIGVDPSGTYHCLKVLSRSPEYPDPAIEGLRRILKVAPGFPLPGERIAGVRIGTTVATNALLERRGGKTLLLITKGFRDLLEIGYQQRNDIFSLCPERPEKLYSAVIEIPERIDAVGKVIRPFSADEAEGILTALDPEAFDSVAVVFLHSWLNPVHEEECEDLLRRLGFSRVHLSHRTSRQIKIVPRGNSTVVDAYLSPVLSAYLETLRKEAGPLPVDFFISSGGVVPPDLFRGRDALLSGPAGGAIAVEAISGELGLKGAIGFDMGGTSTDVCRFDNGFVRLDEKTIGGVRIQAEMIDINTVASGGGSILWYDGEKMRVGPESAGAFPGPACYGFGGPLTLTDANLLTGRLLPEHLPETFGPDRASPVDRGDSERKFIELTEEINRTSGLRLTPEETAFGFIRVADEKMAIAIREVSLSQGVDVRDYSLVCFGGAGGQHACRVAGILGMKEVIFHPLASLFSAYGIGLSKPVNSGVRTVVSPFSEEREEALKREFSILEEEVLPAGEGGEAFIRREIDLRVRGAERHITVPFEGFSQTYREFARRHRDLFGFFRPGTELEALNIRVYAYQEEAFLPHYNPSVSAVSKDPPAGEKIRIFTDGGYSDALLFNREELFPHQVIEGPCMIIGEGTSLLIEPGFRAMVEETGIIRAVRAVDVEEQPLDVTRPDPVMLEVMNNIFMGIATEMGQVLRNTAHSVNIKERLDFSCAVFDREGNLVANAPHIPVHLGAMADTVKAVLRKWSDDMRHGDVFLSNNPYAGGSHLPDLTVVTPVYEDGRIVFFTASRGHHADMGGKVPGSMPPECRHIDEEGILIDGILLMREGTFLEEEVRQILLSHPFPVREIDERIADLIAQIGASRRGEKELRNLIKRYGLPAVERYMGFIQDNAEHSVKRALMGLLGKGKDRLEASMTDCLDDGSPLRVRITVTAGKNPPDSVSALIDFTGSSHQHDTDNLNAPLSVTLSAVLYVLRTITGDDIPLNSGCLRAVRVVAPEGTILNPQYPVPVASGNVETSQRIVDLLLGALGISAASQGTMNNLLFSTETGTPYYETIGGGSGGTRQCHGTSAIQVHMTNTRITDPEVLELRQRGIRLEAFHTRKGSGGEGFFRGGDGTVREFLFLEPAELTVISERRKTPAFGLDGGRPGKRGRNILIRKDGKTEELPHRVSLSIQAGERIRIETPGGGGFGRLP